MDYFANDRVQILGNTEIHFMERLTPAELASCITNMFAFEVPAFVLSRNLSPQPVFLDMCNRNGIPVLRIHMTWGENERAMVPDMADSAAEMMEAAGARNIEPFAHLDRVPGYGIHEVGVARMGANRRSSVLNEFQQTHDVANLFVMDGAGFPSGGCQNPTLTIMALAVRSTDHLLAEMKRGNL